MINRYTYTPPRYDAYADGLLERRKRLLQGDRIGPTHVTANDDGTATEWFESQGPVSDRISSGTGCPAGSLLVRASGEEYLVERVRRDGSGEYVAGPMTRTEADEYVTANTGV